MKEIFSVIIGITILLFSQLVYASAGWTDFVRVAELVPTSRHYYEFKLPVKNNPSGCKNKTWFYQNYGNPSSDKIFNVLLEAIKSGLQLRVYVTGICNINGYSEISSVSIVP